MKTERRRRINPLLNQEKFIKNLMFTSVSLVKDSEYEEYNLHNKNLMFFLNCVSDKLSSISMIGNRNLGSSLIGKIDILLDYYDSIIKQFEKSEKTPTISDFRINYMIDSIKNNIILSDKEKCKYLSFLGDKKDNKMFIENLKMIRESLIDNKYFGTVSDKVYDLITSSDKIDYMLFDDLIDEYLSLLIDYVKVSVFEIKKVFKDKFREFFKYGNETVFYNIFTELGTKYNKFNQYFIFVKTDKEFDADLLTALRMSRNDNYYLFSKSGLINRIETEKIVNKKIFNPIKTNIESYIDNNSYVFSKEIEAKDTWSAIRHFRQSILQPFIGSMLYSGIKIKCDNEYYVIEKQEEKSFINKHQYHDDVFKPLTQDRISYSDVFKKYIIENSSNQINLVVDEAVQLLPYYLNSDSILTKFSNTWFALESLYRNADDKIVKSLDDYACNLVSDRMISGYIYVTASQMKRMYKEFFEKKSNNFIESMFLNYFDMDNKDCLYLDYKVKKILFIIDNYKKYFEKHRQDAQHLLDNAYRIRNRQFHGTKDSQLENISGLIYDVVNDTLSFFIDYLDVYKSNQPNFDSLYNMIKNISLVKFSLINDTDEIVNKITILSDSVRKLK